MFLVVSLDNTLFTTLLHLNSHQISCSHRTRPQPTITSNSTQSPSLSNNMKSKTPLNSALLAISAIAFAALTSATSTFRTEILKPSATISPAAFNGTYLTNATAKYHYPKAVGQHVLEIRDKPARPESLCHGISPMCYAIAHGKRDCFHAWKVCTFLCSPPPLPRRVFSKADVETGSNMTTKPITANTVRGQVGRARRF